MLLAWALDPKVDYTVDENGLPLIFWRPVDADGNDWIPEGQKIGYMWWGIDDELYHSWNFLLTSLYAKSKSVDQIMAELDIYYEKYKGVFALKETDYPQSLSSVMIFAQGALKQGIRSTAYTQPLLLVYKWADMIGFDEVGMMQGSFSLGKERGKSEERAKNIFSETGDKLYQLMERGLVEPINQTPKLLSIGVSLRTIEGGGLSFYDYNASLLDELNFLGNPSFEEWDRTNPKRFWEIVLTFEQIYQCYEIEVPFKLNTAVDALNEGILSMQNLIKYGPPVRAWQNKIKADNITITPEFIALLDSNPNWYWIKRWIARNPHVSLEVLIKLSRDSDTMVKEAIAGNPSTPTDILNNFFEDSTSTNNIREQLAGNPSTPIDTLDRLSRDPEVKVREQLAGNPNVSLEVLIELSKDSDEAVEAAIARNPSTPTDILDRLSKDPKGKNKEGGCKKSKHSYRHIRQIIQRSGGVG